eukprot:1627297-Heterocapsa_arctica.AAC.1
MTRRLWGGRRDARLRLRGTRVKPTVIQCRHTHVYTQPWGNTSSDVLPARLRDTRTTTTAITYC